MNYNEMPELTINEDARMIKLALPEEVRTLYLTQVSVEELRRIFGKIEAADNTLEQIEAMQGYAIINRGLLCGSHKPGVIWDERHTTEFFENRRGEKVARDIWQREPQISFNEWCSQNQIAKEYYAAQQRRLSRRDGKAK